MGNPDGMRGIGWRCISTGLSTTSPKAQSEPWQRGAVQESDCICWNGSKCITFADPFGHGFCLIAFDEETYADTRNRGQQTL